MYPSYFICLISRTLTVLQGLQLYSAGTLSALDFFCVHVIKQEHSMLSDYVYFSVCRLQLTFYWVSVLIRSVCESIMHTCSRKICKARSLPRYEQRVCSAQWTRRSRH